MCTISIVYLSNIWGDCFGPFWREIPSIKSYTHWINYLFLPEHQQSHPQKVLGSSYLCYSLTDFIHISYYLLVISLFVPYLYYSYLKCAPCISQNNKRDPSLDLVFCCCRMQVSRHVNIQKIRTNFSKYQGHFYMVQEVI